MSKFGTDEALSLVLCSWASQTLKGSMVLTSVESGNRARDEAVWFMLVEYFHRLSLAKVNSFVILGAVMRAADSKS